MWSRLLLCLLFSLTLSVSAQEPVAAIAGDQPTIALYGRLAEHAARLLPMLAQIRTKEWIAQGASETYVQQAESATVQLKAVQQDMTALEQRPDALQDGMKALFRVQAFHRVLDEDADLEDLAARDCLGGVDEGPGHGARARRCRRPA